LTTAIQEAQNLNESNPALVPTRSATFCNYGTQNVLSTVATATDNASGLLMKGIANSMVDQFAKSSLLQNVDQATAEAFATKGGLALVGYNNTSQAPHNHGHVATFSVGNNISKGKVANIGISNGFLPIGPGKGAVFSKQATLNNVKYYILSPWVTPKRELTKIPFVTEFH
jgi:hypothetical protein